MMLPPSRYYPAYVNPDISTFPGNRILAPFNLIQWTSGGSDNDASYTLAPQPPLLYKYNGDVAAQALVDHYTGASPLDAATLGAGARRSYCPNAGVSATRALLPCATQRPCSQASVDAACAVSIWCLASPCLHPPSLPPSHQRRRGRPQQRRQHRHHARRLGVRGHVARL